MPELTAAELYELVGPVCDRDGGPGWPARLVWYPGGERWELKGNPIECHPDDARYILEGHFRDWLESRFESVRIYKHDRNYGGAKYHVRTWNQEIPEDVNGGESCIAALVAAVMATDGDA